MANYDFSTLNSSDLEELVCDLLNAVARKDGTGLIFKTFKDGKDQGIDFLYSTAEHQFEIIGQVKHYYRSGVAALIAVLKDEELKKIEKLKPKKYIVATSVDLSVSSTLSIKKVFGDFLEIRDIYGKKDLNGLLERFPDVLSSHFKLWYSSTSVLQKLLNYRFEGRSDEFREHELKKKLRLFVETGALSLARTKLLEANYIIITGEPGVGKTTTAEMLLYELIREGFYLTYIYDDIKEIEKVLKLDDSRQVFYFDDFLGHTEEEIVRSKGSDAAITKLLRTLSKNSNKKLILTTRTFILNSAVNSSERLRQLNVKARESTIELHHYSTDHKYQILDNHIQESELPDEIKQILQEKKLQNFIVNHENFSPRSIEYITAADRIPTSDPQQFSDFVIENFNKPDEIWRHAYERQICEYDRLLLNTMASFGDSVDLEQLENAFDARLSFEVKNGGLQRQMSAFRNSFKHLNDGFIRMENILDRREVAFINHSLTDFLTNYIKASKGEVVRIMESTLYVKQLTTRILPITRRRQTKLELSVFFVDRLMDYESIYVKSATRNEDYFSLAIMFYYYLDVEKSVSLVNEIFAKIDSWDFLSENEELIYAATVFLQEVISTDVIDVLCSRIEFFVEIFASQNTVEDGKSMLMLISEKFTSEIFKQFSGESRERLSDHYSGLLNQRIEEDIEDLLHYNDASSAADAKEAEAQSLQIFFSKFNIEVEANLNMYRDVDWLAIGNENYFREQMERDD